MLLLEYDSNFGMLLLDYDSMVAKLNFGKPMLCGTIMLPVVSGLVDTRRACSL